jgi:hypothetical protein
MPEPHVCSFVISKLPDGGYVVTDVPPMHGMMATFLYAASSIVDALNYVKQKMEERNNG